MAIKNDYLLDQIARFVEGILASIDRMRAAGAGYAVYALGRAADAYDAQGNPVSQVRRAQAQALADAYGFAVTAVPPEVEEALKERDEQ